MKPMFLLLAFAVILPRLLLAANDSQSLPIVDVKKVVITEGIAKDAYLWGYPLVRFERTKRLMTTTPGYGHAPMNYFFHASRLPLPQDRDVSNPLPDSLYSSAFLDLREQPMVLEIPRIKDRFYSLQFFDAFTNSIAIVSSRTRGESAGKFFITGPNFIGGTPTGFEHIRSSTNFAWVNGRIEADDISGAKSAYKLIRKYELKPYNVYLGKQRMGKKPVLSAKMSPQMDPRRIANAGVGFYDELGTALRENEPTNLDSAKMNRFRTANIGTAMRTSGFTNTRELREAYVRAATAAELDMDRSVRKDLVSHRNGWNFVLSNSDVKPSDTLRAAMSKYYFGQSNPLESLHPVTYVDTNNVRLNGNSSYVLRFAKDKLPPIGAFWSIAPYNTRERSLIDNNLKRFSLGSYSKNLSYNPDGSLDIYISSNEPRGRTANWLPVPRGSFYVMMNLYNPTNDVIQGNYNLPRIQRMNLTPFISLNK